VSPICLDSGTVQSRGEGPQVKRHLRRGGVAKGSETVWVEVTGI